MTTVEEHKKIIKELEEDIKEKIRRGIIAQRQKIIGFATSEGSVNCFALFLHRQKLISEGFNVNHRWFSSVRKFEEKFPFDFPYKQQLLNKLIREEQLRDRLCYGKSKTTEDVEEAIRIFFDIKKIVEKEISEEI